MIYGEDQVQQYFGYNSILTVDGKRIRRLRRTEVSTTKLATLRYKSPQDSRSTASKGLKLRQNKSSDISTPLAHSRSKLSLKCVNSLQNGLNRLKQSVHSDYQYNFVLHQFPTQNSFANTERTDPNTQQKNGQYFLGGNSYGSKIKKLKKRSISKAQSQKQMSKPNENSVCGQNSRRQQTFQYFGPPPNIPNLPKYKKKVESCKVQACNQSSQQIKQVSNFNLKESIRSKSKSRLKVSNGNSRLSQSSNLNRQSTVKVDGALSQVSVQSSKISLEKRLQSEKNIETQKVKQYFNSSGLQSGYESSSNRNTNTLGAKSISSKLQITGQNGEKYQPSMHRSVHSSKIRSQIKIRQQSKLEKSSQLNSKFKEPSLTSSKGLKHYIVQDISRRSIQEDMIEQKPSFKTPPMMNKKDTFGTIPSKQIKQNSELKLEEKPSKSIRFNPENTKQQSPKKMKPASQYTVNDVVQNIEEHDIRLGFIYLFVDNTHKAYETNITFQRYERLCFLMLKKYLYQKNRLIKTLKGDDKCLTLSGAQVPHETMMKFKQSAQVKERLGYLIEESRQIFKEVDQQYHKIHRKYSKDKYIKLEAPRDNFSKEIMKLLMEELTKLYQQIQNEEIQNDQVESSEERIVQIIQIMFLISELNGRPVKEFELMQEHQIDFDEYYNQHYENIIETTEYFERLKE